MIYQRRERHYSVCFLTQVFLGPKATDWQSESSRSFCILWSPPTKSFKFEHRLFYRSHSYRLVQTGR